MSCPFSSACVIKRAKHCPWLNDLNTNRIDGRKGRRKSVTRKRCRVSLFFSCSEAMQFNGWLSGLRRKKIFSHAWKFLEFEYSFCFPFASSLQVCRAINLLFFSISVPPLSDASLIFSRRLHLLRSYIFAFPSRENSHQTQSNWCRLMKILKNRSTGDSSASGCQSLSIFAFAGQI